MGANAVEFPAESPFPFFPFAGAPCFLLAGTFTGTPDQILDLSAHLTGLAVLCPAFEQRQFLVQVLRIAMNMSQARLAILGMGSVVGSQSIGHQHTPK